MKQSNLQHTENFGISFEPTVLRANAGTGKTFQLSNRFLQLLCAGERPERILATTFTRKAAAEIQARIFSRLAVAAKSESAAKRLGDELGGGLLTQKRVVELLQTLISEQHRLSICTLDSLYSKLLRMFALELGFVGKIAVATDEQNREINDRAIAHLLAKNTPDVLRELMKLVGKGKESARINARLSQMVDSAHTLYLQSSEHAWHSIQVINTQEDDPIDLGIEKLKKLPPVLTQVEEPNKNYQRALLSDIGRAQSRNWAEFLTNGMVKALVAGDGTYYQKVIPDNYVDAYRPLIEHAKASFLRQKIEETSALYKLISAFHQSYLAERQRSGTLSFSDVKLLLAEAALGDSIQDLYFRLDTNISHLLLDEFQDTSMVEWELIQPIAEEVLSKSSGIESSFLCVGDVKQAIYGWRGGVAEIFDAVTSIWPQVNLRLLTKSYRSAEEIIAFVNATFLRIEQTTISSKFPRVAATWKERFTLHETARPELVGYVKVSSLEAETDPENEEEELVAQCRLVVQKIVEDNPCCSVGILVPQNKDVRRIVRALRSAEIEASEEGGNPLTDSKAVLVFLSLFLLIDHPGDTIARFHVRNSPLGDLIGVDDWTRDDSVSLAMSNLRAKVMMQGIGPCILELLHLSVHVWSASDRERLEELAELGFSFDSRRALRLRHFVSFVELKRSEHARASTVRVMTYHKSKGLEFDAVLLPFLHRPWIDPRKGERLWCGYDSKVSPPSTIITSFPKDLVTLHPEVEKLWLQMRESRILESLHVLYVALTRPKHALYAFLPPARTVEEKGGKKKVEKEKPISGALLLREIFASEANSELVLYEAGNKGWASVHPVHKTSRSELKSTQPRKFELKLSKSSIRASSFVTASSLEGGERATVGSKLFKPFDRYNEGIIFHKIFEAIDWIDSTAMTSQVANLILDRQPLEPSKRAKMIDEFKCGISAEEIAGLFDRSKYEAGGHQVSLYRELPFAISAGDRMLRGVIDRVVIQEKDGARKAFLVDFKSDRTSSREIDGLVAFYRPQLEVYADAVSKIFELPRSAVISVLAFIRIGRAVEI